MIYVLAHIISLDSCEESDDEERIFHFVACYYCLLRCILLFIKQFSVLFRFVFFLLFVVAPIQFNICDVQATAHLLNFGVSLYVDERRVIGTMELNARAGCRGPGCKSNGSNTIIPETSLSRPDLRTTYTCTECISSGRIPFPFHIIHIRSVNYIQ